MGIQEDWQVAYGTVSVLLSLCGTADTDILALIITRCENLRQQSSVRTAACMNERVLYYLYLVLASSRYQDSVYNTAEENSSVFSLIRMHCCCQQGHMGSKTLHQQNPPLLNWRCRLHPFNGPLSRTTQVSLYQKGKPVWILLKQVAVASGGPYASMHLASDR